MRKEFLLVVALLCLTSMASASAIVVDGGWYGFCFDGAGTAAYVGCQNDGVGAVGNTVTFTASGPVLFELTDAFQYGDEFKVSIDGGAFLFSNVVPDISGTETNPNLAFGDIGYSHLVIALGAGAHTADIFVTDSPWLDGGAYVQVVTDRGQEVPEPATLILLGSGLAGLIFRRKHATP